VLRQAARPEDCWEASATPLGQDAQRRPQTRGLVLVRGPVAEDRVHRHDDRARLRPLERPVHRVDAVGEPSSEILVRDRRDQVVAELA
jgi:hypothetical protein